MLRSESERESQMYISCFSLDLIILYFVFASDKHSRKAWIFDDVSLRKDIEAAGR